MDMLRGKCVVLGVTGSIAAYKIASLASALVKLHADVNVIMTKNATNFINPITFETPTGNKCLVDTFDRNFQFNVEHVSLAKRADLFLVAPASANVIGKMANGLADDMLTTTILAAKCPKLVSPAMNTNMYENPIVQDNLKKLETLSQDIKRQDISLEDALKDFEEGIKLAKSLEKELDKIEGKIQILINQGEVQDNIVPAKTEKAPAMS